jgi:arylsulfatase A-like enzyme
MKHSCGILAILVLFCSSTLSHAQSSNASAATLEASASGQRVANGKPRPNILFIIMDDVGIDQMQIFGYGGGTAPLTPNINAVARAGVRFRNVWSMPECSPSRAIFFEGRYPLRTNINAAILSDDLANSQVSPFESTTPKLLQKAGYQNGLFGKFHLAGPNNNPFGRTTPHVLGWNHFDGFLEGAPYPIDTSIGGQFVPPPNDPSYVSPYTCGFIPNKQRSPAGADSGACHFINSTCSDIGKDAAHPTPGFSCLQAGGIFVPNQTCKSSAGKALDFTHTNAYYAWKRVINEEDGSVIPANENGLPLARGYVSDTTTTSAADWIHRQDSEGQPWMATVAYANDHTPYQQPPRELLPVATPDSSGFSCTGNSPANVAATRIISNQMIEAMDAEIGHLLVQSGLASTNRDGSLNYDPRKTNTMVIIIGDNGTFAPGVKVPFDSNRAKGYVYQTGVWVPLIVSGPLVASPNREVTNMVNIADLFQLFGEFAGIDVHKAVPKSHVLDSQTMLPYLTTVNHRSIRQTNFTQTANNIHLNDVPPAPCVLTITTPIPTCVQLFDSPQLCNFEGGEWYGEDMPQHGTPYGSCCAVQRAGIYKTSDNPDGTLALLPVDQAATRNDQFKLVKKTVTMCSADASDVPLDPNVVQTEFYKINEKAVNPQIDKDGDSLCGEGCPSGLKGVPLVNFLVLNASMNATLTSEPACQGDGNEDKRVNLKDVADWTFFHIHDGESSWYDFNHDGLTNNADLKQYILPNLGKNCLKKN